MSDLVGPDGQPLTSGTLDEAQVAGLMAHEIRELEAGVGPAVLMLPGDLLLAIVGLVQLALRHPNISVHLREQGETFVGCAREYFANAPTVLEIIQRGDDPREDV